VVVAKNVSLTASPGDVVAVEGPNGSGKTTLLAAAAGLLPADGTTVRPGSVGYAPERAGVLPRIALHQMTGLHLAAGLFGAGLGSLLALIERAGYRFLVAVAVFLGMFIIRHTPLTPLLTLATNPVTAHTSIAGPTAWLYGPGAVLLALAALLATRVT